VTIEQGPQSKLLTEEEEVVRRDKALRLGPTEYLKVQNRDSGAFKNVVGPQLFFPAAEDKVGNVQSALKLSACQYLHIAHHSGKLRLVKGPQLFIPAVDEDVKVQLTATTLKQYEYMRILNEETGEIRVETGEAVVFLQPNEKIAEHPKRGVNIDANQAVLVRDLRSGQLSLIDQQQVFTPTAAQELVEVREKIRLEEYDTVGVKDIATSEMRFVEGPTAFFLQPYTELLKMQWSSGIQKDKRDLRVTKFDRRPHFMWYEFEARTQDNVELVLGVTFFWGIKDVRKLVMTTPDAPGDLCSHARSMIIQLVSQMNLEQFLGSFNAVVCQAVFGPPAYVKPEGAVETETAAGGGGAVGAAGAAGSEAWRSFDPLWTPAAGTDGEGDGAGAAAGAAGGSSCDPFYAERGIDIQGVEVRSVGCKDPGTQRILQEIIKEHTNRISRMQQAESENEVTMKRMQGEIGVMRTKNELLDQQADISRKEGEMEGQGEAARVRTFFEGLGTVVPDVERRIELFNTLRRVDTLEALSKASGVRMYFTPSDVNLKIDSA
jgi:hypothetical protein